MSPPPNPGSAPTREAASELLYQLARSPRPAGSAAENAARETCAEWLESLGMEVRRESFTYSAFPGRWGTPLSGVAVIGVFLSAGHVGNDGSAPLALAILVFGLAAIGVAGWWLARYGVLSLPLARREGVNLTAVRTVAGRIPDDTAWFMAHLDSK